MEQVNIHNAKTHLSRLLERAGAGEEIVIAKSGKPIAKLVPVQPSRQERRKGLMKGKIKIGKDFDHPLPEEFRQRLKGKQIENSAGYPPDALVADE